MTKCYDVPQQKPVEAETERLFEIVGEMLVRKLNEPEKQKLYIWYLAVHGNILKEIAASTQ